MKKFYGYFVYNNEQYVIRFKLGGSIKWDEEAHCFIDEKMYMRSAAYMICLAALDTHFANEKEFSCCAFIIPKKDFIEYRSQGIKRWKPQREIIIW